MRLKTHSRNDTPFLDDNGIISTYWNAKRLNGRRFQLIRMRERREAEIDKYRQFIAELESHIESINDELKDAESMLRERLKENPQNANYVILIRTKTGYTKAKFKYLGKWRWVHLGVTKNIVQSDDELKKQAVRQFNENFSKSKKTGVIS